MLRKAIQRSLTRPNFVQPAVRYGLPASSRFFSVHGKQPQEVVETVKPTSGKRLDFV
jgi:hypothetical protein